MELGAQSPGNGWRRLSLAGLALVAIACAEPRDPPSATIDDRLGMPPEAVEGTMRVPARRSVDPAAGSQSLELAYLRLPSVDPAGGTPIVYLPPGPGWSAIDALSGPLGGLLETLAEDGDLLLLDHRGSGRSEPRDLRCRVGPLPADRAGERELYWSLMVPHFADCLARLGERGVDVGGFTVAESAADIADLARSLGVERLRILGVGYGSQLALALLRTHPELVDRLALVSVEGPNQTFEMPAALDRHLARLSRRSGEEPGADPADLVGLLEARLAALEAEPLEVRVSWGRRLVVGRWDLAKWLSDDIRRGRHVERLPRRLSDLARGDWIDLAEWAAGYRAGPFVNVMSVATDCASSASPERAAAIEEQRATSLLGDLIDFPTNLLCDAPGLPRLDDSWRAPVESDVPVLLVSGELDGRTPPENAEEVAETLSRSTLATIEEGGHGVELLSRRDVRELVEEFLVRRE